MSTKWPRDAGTSGARPNLLQRSDMPDRTSSQRRKTFWEFVTKTDTCWLWTGPRWGGYGRYRHAQAHRLAYEALVGPIPKGLVIDHLCRVRHCVNPAHMEPVTNVENVMRGLAPSAVNARKTHCIHGHEFTPENTRPKPKGRECRECFRLICRRSRRRKAAA